MLLILTAILSGCTDERKLEETGVIKYKTGLLLELITEKDSFSYEYLFIFDDDTILKTENYGDYNNYYGNDSLIGKNIQIRYYKGEYNRNTLIDIKIM